jgi:Telomere regulation protein Stn1
MLQPRLTIASPGQDLYFHRNHPIKWVRVAGVVVAIDDFHNRRIYTVDDSSGSTIECVVKVPQPPAGSDRALGAKQESVAAKASKTTVAETNQEQSQKLDSEVDVGHIIDIKGGVGIFRDMKQILVEKITHLRSTEQEVRFWEKVTQLRNEVLNQPWVLSEREVRKCRRKAEGHDEDRAARHKRKAAEAAAAKAGSHRDGESRRHEKIPPKPIAKRTGLEKRVKSVKKTLPIAEKYNALGL